MSKQPSKPKTAKERAAELGAPKTFHELKAVAEEWGIEIPLKAPFTPDDINKVTPLLRLPLPEEALQETSGKDTGRGYDTTGYSYQAHIDRMNWVFGPAHWTWEIQNETCEEGRTSTNRQKFTYYGEIVVKIGYKELNPETKRYEWVIVHDLPPYPTDHESLERGSARKGMLTKGIKRATSTIGVGADAWLGIFDDDLITGAAPGEMMAGPAAHISERDFDYLARTAERKGLTLEKLRNWYEQELQITNEPAKLTPEEFERVKKLLFTIPQGKTYADMVQRQQQSTPPEPQNSPQEARNTPPTTKDTTEHQETQENSAQEAEGMPKTLDELIALPDERIRELAKMYRFNMPASINDTNRRPLCKALATLMKIV